MRFIAVFVLLSSALVIAGDRDAVTGVIGVREEMLSPDFWIARTKDAGQVLLSGEQIRKCNALTLSRDPMVDLSKLGKTARRSQIADWLKSAGSLPSTPVIDRTGRTIPQSELDSILANAAEDRIPVTVDIRYALCVRRSPVRTLPTSLQAYTSTDLTDFDVFDGGVLFPGEPAAVVHESKDGNWRLIVSTQGSGWIRREDLAEGPSSEVLAYAEQPDARVVTGDQVRTVFTPEAPELSEMLLDMGVRVPLAHLPLDQPVNGEGDYASWPVELPVRTSDGALRLAPALIRRTADTSADYLPLTRTNLIRQAFKFLGERYGWGHAYNARDCSGFTSDVYKSMGLILPANSGAQGQSAAFPHELFTATDSHQVRLAAVMHADVGDLLVVPGHVMMLLGKFEGQPYVIQDVPFAVYRDARGNIRRTRLNEVSVTPLLPLLADAEHSYVDAMVSLVHVTAPAAAGE